MYDPLGYNRLKGIVGAKSFGREQEPARMITSRAGLITYGVHMAGLPDRYSNMTIGFSARIDELGRQPYTARDFFIKYQDRIVFGIDTPPSPGVYRCYFRLLETRDEYFEFPDYIGRWGHSRWRIYGLDLPDEVLRKVYSENARRVIPGLA